MRGVVLCLIAAGFALGTVLAASAAQRPYAKARALVAQAGDTRYGVAASSRDGGDSAAAQVQDAAVSVDDGEATAQANPGATGSADARATGVSVLGGRVTAERVTRSATENGAGGTVTQLVVDGSSYGTVRARRTIALDGGGKVVVNSGDTGLHVLTDAADVRVAVASVAVVAAPPAPTPTPTPTPVPTPAPTRTTAPVTPTPTARPRKVKRKQAPKVSRQLTRRGYAFPVYSAQAQIDDTFGAARAAPIGVHLGDDIFAPFGSPVVAVRDGRLDHVGTLPISGNRLWLHTANGDAFFYAHLSAFSPAARNGARVKAGAVIGFVGTTGEAEKTPPHLHFEIHPGGMNKPAVDPFPILTAWQSRDDVPPGAWLQQLGPDATQRPGTLVTVRDFIAE